MSAFRILVFLFFLLFTTDSFSQMVTNELPLGFKHKTSVGKLETVHLNVEKSILKSERNKPTSQQFAYLINTNISPSEQGMWTEISGGKLWRIELESQGAFSLNFTLEPFLLPLGAKLFFYSADSSYIVGAITSANNKNFKKLSVQAIPGDKVIVEYFLPSSVLFKNDFRITRIGHDYKNSFGENLAGACEVNVNCDEGLDWQIEKRAVAKIIINNTYYCTGALINNTSQDSKPYFLTAAHCIHQYSEAENSVFYFNYETPDCEGLQSPQIQTISGSTLIATGKNENLDFSLIELTELPPESYNPYLAGWSRTSDIPADVTTIHHPDGDIKKISRDYDATVLGDFGYGYDSYSHWQILRWDVGTTEGGSSGSPLFNSEHLIVGDLTGGEATCTNPVNDYYSRLDRAWSDYSEDFYQLENWLDPTASGVQKLEGLDPYVQKYRWDIAAYSLKGIDKSICSDTIKPNFIIKNRGIENVQQFYYEVFVDGELIYSDTYSKTILSGELLEFSLDKFYLAFGDHELNFVVSNPNGENDENTANDTISSKFSLINGSNIQLNLLTDEYGYETSWVLQNEADEQIYTSTVYDNSTFYSSNFCLENSCYVFRIFDQSSDGICCDYGYGEYSLTNLESNELIASGSDFLAEDSTSFCLVPANVVKDQDFPYKIYPNPLETEDFNIEAYVDGSYTVSIYNLQSKLVFSKNEVFGALNLNLSSWKNGIYIVHLSFEDKHVVDKMIIMR